MPRCTWPATWRTAERSRHERFVGAPAGRSKRIVDLALERFVALKGFIYERTHLLQLADLRRHGEDPLSHRPLDSRPRSTSARTATGSAALNAGQLDGLDVGASEKDGTCEGVRTDGARARPAGRAFRSGRGREAGDVGPLRRSR